MVNIMADITHMAHKVVCTGCSLLCDDIEVDVDGERITSIRNTCYMGVGRFFAKHEPMIDIESGHAVDIATNTATGIAEAAKRLRQSKNPVIFGLDNSTSGAQKKGIELAEALGAVIDDSSSFCQGPFVEAILNNRLPTCTLDDIRNKADVVVFWGADPQNSHPRHLSRFSYFPRGEQRQRGWEEDRDAIVIDVRHSDTVEICKNRFYQIPPKGDGEFIEALTKAMHGKVSKTSFNFDIKRLMELANTIKNAEFPVICVGLGYTYSASVDLMQALIESVSEFTQCHVMPMIGHYNMYGFNRELFSKTGAKGEGQDSTGFINSVSFKDGIKHGSEHSFINSVKTADCVLIIGSDPLSTLPHGCIPNDVDIITIDPHETPTTRRSSVWIQSAISGVECGGLAYRMDGVEVSFEKIVERGFMSDEEILTKILEEI